MTPEVKQVLTDFFASIWSIFTQTPVPGTNITFAQLWVGLFATSVFVAFLHKTLDNESAYKSGRGDYISEGDEKE